MLTSACSKSTGSAVSSLPTFQISAEDTAKLSDVGCALNERDVKCDESVSPRSSQGSKLNTLKSIQKQQEAQKAALDKVVQTVKAAGKSGKYNSINTTILTAGLESASIQCSAHIAESIVAVTNEENYQTVIGYHCEGSYKNDSEFKTAADFLLGAPGSPKVVRDDNANYVSWLDLSANDQKISYKLTDTVEASKQRLRQLVQTDGEFTAGSENSAQMNCSRTRLYGSARPFSDRIPQISYFQCVLTSTFGGKASSASISYPVTSSDEREDDLVVIEATDENLNHRPEGRVLFQKYVGHASTDQGILRLRIEDLSSKKEVLTFSTPSSTDNFRLNVDDNKGNAYDVNCTSKLK